MLTTLAKGKRQTSRIIAIALLAVVPTYMIYYVVQPMPGNLAIQQIIGDSILLLILGVVVAALNRSADAES